MKRSLTIKGNKNRETFALCKIENELYDFYELSIAEQYYDYRVANYIGYIENRDKIILCAFPTTMGNWKEINEIVQSYPSQ